MIHSASAIVSSQYEEPTTEKECIMPSSSATTKTSNNNRRALGDTTNGRGDAAAASPAAKKARTTSRSNDAPAAESTTVATASTAASTTAAPFLTPHTQVVQKLQAELQKQGGCGYMMVRGMDISEKNAEDYDDASDDELKAIHARLTTQQANHLRVIFIPPARKANMETISQLIVEDEHGLFNTSFSYKVVDSYKVFRKKYNSTKGPKKKFNYLFGFTECLHRHDEWMNDHGSRWGTDYGGCAMIRGLARQWKTLLHEHASAPATELGLDEEFSWPGLQAFLQKFKRDVEAVDMYDEPALKFNYK